MSRKDFRESYCVKSSSNLGPKTTQPTAMAVKEANNTAPAARSFAFPTLAWRSGCR